jgi:hypothetical protein
MKLTMASRDSERSIGLCEFEILQKFSGIDPSRNVGRHQLLPSLESLSMTLAFAPRGPLITLNCYHLQVRNASANWVQGCGMPSSLASTDALRS